MKKISIDELIDMVDSRYSLVTLISKRARQIVAGQDILIKTDTFKPVCVAIEEFFEGAYEAVYETEEQKREGIKDQERIRAQAKIENFQEIV